MVAHVRMRIGVIDADWSSVRRVLHTDQLVGRLESFCPSQALAPRVRVVHEGEVLAADVEVADSVLAKMRGLMFRRSLPDEFALMFRFGAPARRSVHMLFVRFPIDVVWLADSRVTKTATLSPWRGFGRARADTILEFPAGATAAVEQGDRVRIESEVEVDRP